MRGSGIVQWSPIYHYLLFRRSGGLMFESSLHQFKFLIKFYIFRTLLITSWVITVLVQWRVWQIGIGAKLSKEQQQPGNLDYILVQGFRVYWLIVNWRINKLLLPHNLYSGAKHIPLSSQRPFHFHCSIGALFIVTRQTQ